MKVLYLANIPSPYRVDFFNELGKLCDLTVLFERERSTERDTAWTSENNNNYKSVFLKGIRTDVNTALSFEVIKYLREDYDAIIVGGYSTPTSMIALLYLKLFRKKYVLNADGGILKGEKKLVYLFKRFFISGAQCYLSTGEKTDKYFIHYGAKVDKIRHYPFTSLFLKDVDSCPATQAEKTEIRKELDLPEDKKIVLAIGQFIHRKGFDLLLDFWAELPENIVLLLIGGGPLEDEYKLQVKGENVLIEKFKTKDVLKKYYRASDLFVLPTREDIWGLVINEAMAHGLPVVSTDNCVSATELISDDENGYVVKTNNSEELKIAIEKLLQSDEKCKFIGTRNIEKIKKYTIEEMAIVHKDILISLKG